MKPKPAIPLLKNLLTMVNASVGTKMFRKLYINTDDHSSAPAQDILRDGDLSCAYYVSSILKLFNLIGEVHATVGGTVRDLEVSGWKKVKTPKPGAIIVWMPQKFKNGELHRHIGFFIGGGKAISNSSKKRSPQKHDWDYRPVEAVLWNPKLK